MLEMCSATHYFAPRLELAIVGGRQMCPFVFPQRRCWSTELHRRFVNALQQLGGSQAATGKQIRELMQVEGLTNYEVKSHPQVSFTVLVFNSHKSLNNFNKSSFIIARTKVNF